MTTEWSKRRSLLALTFIAKSTSKNLLIRNKTLFNLSLEQRTSITYNTYWQIINCKEPQKEHAWLYHFQGSGPKHRLISPMRTDNWTYNKG